jgi:pimeloyl-ACP methyl ester carboxylesterase
MTEHPVLLIPGWACPAGYWEPVAGRLRVLGHQVELVTLPGYGPESPLPEGFGWTVSEAAEWLAEKVRRRQPDPGAAAPVGQAVPVGQPVPVHLVGHSLGGSIGATLAAMHPELVATLTLVGMVPVPPAPAVRTRLAELFLTDLLLSDPGDSAQVDPQAAQQCLHSWYGSIPPEHRAMLEAPFKLPAGVVLASLQAGLEGAAPEVPDRIVAPTQVIVGAGDGMRPPATVEDYLARHPAWRAVVVPGAGHMVHWEAPEQCTAAIHTLIHPPPNPLSHSLDHPLDHPLAKPQFLQEKHRKNSNN